MLKWNELERTENQPDYPRVDALVEWCDKHNIRIKGHCLVWGWLLQGHPAWLESYAPDEVSRKLEKRIREVVSRYRGKIDIWDVVNEPLHCHWFSDNMSNDYAEKALLWAREANPKAQLLVNEYGCHTGAADNFVKYCRNLQDGKIPLDAVGEQAHDSPVLYSPQNVFETLDKLAGLGLDVHLTEITQPSNDSEITGGFIQGKWTEEMQAKWYRYYYTLTFSHPNVKAITMWAMWDGSSWLPKGGVIAKDWTPKPAYRELDSMINKEWRTNLSGVTGDDGKYAFRGFYGNYELTVVADGKTTVEKMHLAEGGRNVLRMVAD